MGGVDDWTLCVVKCEVGDARGKVFGAAASLGVSVFPLVALSVRFLSPCSDAQNYAPRLYAEVVVGYELRALEFPISNPESSNDLKIWRL